MEAREVTVVRVEWADRRVEARIRIWVNYDPDLPVYSGRVVVFSDSGRYDLPWVWSLLGLDGTKAMWSSDAEMYYVELEVVRFDGWTDLFESLCRDATRRLSALADHVRRREAARRFLEDGWDMEVQRYKM
jgi:hypothetical protein